MIIAAFMVTGFGIASVYAVVQSDRTVPSSETYAVMNAVRVRSARPVNSAASAS